MKIWVLTAYVATQFDDEGGDILIGVYSDNQLAKDKQENLSKEFFLGKGNLFDMGYKHVVFKIKDTMINHSIW